jgi:hypothetical protein
MKGSILFQIGSSLRRKRFTACADDCEFEGLPEFGDKVIILEAVAADWGIRRA